jgi:Protein of Unknown function (DUF2604)
MTRDTADKPKPDKKITLTISTLSGDFTGDFPANQKLKVAFEKTIKKLGLTGEEWILDYQGQQLSLDATIADAGLADGAVLTLSTPEGGGGSRGL